MIELSNWTVPRLESETGHIVDIGNDWNMNGGHIQGIAQAGKYTVLSSDKALFLAHGASGYPKNLQKIVSVQTLPNKYEHAGGIDVLQNNNQWWIVVPVWSKESHEKSAILHYLLSLRNGNRVSLKKKGVLSINGARAYAVGIAQTSEEIVMAVVIDNEGNKVLFLKNEPNLGDNGFYDKYQQLGDIWDARNTVGARYEWKPDKNWGSYPNSISLIVYQEQIYFVGMHNTLSGKGHDWVDIYSVNRNKDAGDVQLIKKQNAHAICKHGPSFRWGGNAQILRNKKIEILAVERNVQKDCLARYNKFHLDLNT